MRATTALLLAALAAADALATTITLDRAGVLLEQGEVCRFRAGDRENPFQRWLASQDLTCVAAGSAMTIPPGTWNVFGKAAGLLTAPVLLDGESAPDKLSLSLDPAATITAALPTETHAVIYAPRFGSAYPMTAGAAVVPSEVDLWLLVLEKSTPVAVIPIAPLEPGSSRAVDARVGGPSAVIAWLKLAESDQVALAKARNLSAPRVRLTGAGPARDSDPLSPLTLLNGSFVRVSGVSAGEAQLESGGRGWISSARRVKIASTITSVSDPLIAYVATTIIVNWSAANDLPALNRLIGSCEPGRPPQLEVSLAACQRPERPGGEIDPASCREIRKETFAADMTFGSFTVEDVIPGMYRAEMRFGNLPPVHAAEEANGGQIRNLHLQAWYLTLYGSLTRGGESLGEDATIQFPAGGVGFASRESPDYHAVLLMPMGPDAQIKVEACDGAPQAVVLSGRPTRGSARFDINIPVNELIINVSDTFTRDPLPGATARVTIMSLRTPRRPVFTRTVTTDDDGRAVLTALPEREVHIAVSLAGYQKMDVDPFSMTEREEKTFDIQLVPLRGNRGKILSQRPFDNASIIWFSPAGTETERADVGPDGTFVYSSSHENSETMSVISMSHPLWTTRAPATGRRETMEVRFPDASPREFDVFVDRGDPRVTRHIGMLIGGVRVPLPVLREHQRMRRQPATIRGAGPVHFTAIAETGPIDVVLGPRPEDVGSISAAIDLFALPEFATAPRHRVVPGATSVTLPSP